MKHPDPQGSERAAMTAFWQRLKEREDAVQDADPGYDISRRAWLKLLGASAALAGVGCNMRPERFILPYAGEAPEHAASERVTYATSMDLEGLATGLLVDTHVGRPVKVEGNPLHPAGSGATLAIHQGALLQLYDPERARSSSVAGQAVTTERLLRALADRAGIRDLWVITPPQSSPLVRTLFDRIRARHPGARIHSHAPLSRGNAYRGAELAYGEALEVEHRLQHASVVLSLDADFLAAPATALRYARSFADGRRLASPIDAMNRLYVVESTPTPTGMIADHRLAVRPSRVGTFALALSGELSGLGVPLERGVRPDLARSAAQKLDERGRRLLRVVARDLAAARGRCAIVVGDGQPPEVHALAYLLQSALDASPSVLRAFPSSIHTQAESLSPRELADAISGGSVHSLALLGIDLVYSASADLDLGEKLAKLDDTLCWGLHRDETSEVCRRFIAASHFMESWGDSLAYDGTRSAVQPLIEPLYDTASMVEVLAALGGERNPNARALLRQAWAPDARTSDDERFAAFLATGFAAGSGHTPLTPNVSPSAALFEELPALLERDLDVLQLQVVASNSVYDGRFAGVGWLQELPQPLTSLTWGNAALVSQRLASKLDLNDGDEVTIRQGSLSIDAPALVVPGQPDDVVSLAAGYGQRASKHATLAMVGGANVFRVWTSRSARWVADVAMSATGQQRALAVIQQHRDQHEREIALASTLHAYREDPAFTHRHRGSLPTMHPSSESRDSGWMMAIDTSVCTGCNACITACQAENNVPIVGPEGVRHNREMHWLRVDHYLQAEPSRAGNDLHVVNQPMMCQHCDDAPCEYVCPVGATTHSPDGLNEMVYNRCIGTRFCSNNCPYKVRRFNWFDYNQVRDSRDLALNPDVTVRERGVMEKCTYCVQRVRRAEQQSRMRGDAEVAAGAVVTACQQACPTGAIQFAQRQHTQTAAMQWERQPRHYKSLHELGTRPRTTYLAKIRNPHPDLEPTQD